ncbi:hypothetical protein ABZT45_28575, partial [Streptomyces sp. NPDC005356]|uniref:hypothetical protein n=1 Tax=Streptomyces sp. NPDC005356 TaxID=3157167 RepID=UPI0033AA2A9B
MAERVRGVLAAKLDLVLRLTGARRPCCVRTVEVLSCLRKLRKEIPTYLAVAGLAPRVRLTTA